MSREHAEELVTLSVGRYAAPAAVVELLVAATEGPIQWQEHIHRALAALDLDRALLPEREPLDEIAASIGHLLAGMLRTADRKERLRLSGLLEAVVREGRAVAARDGVSA